MDSYYKEIEQKRKEVIEIVNNIDSIKELSIIYYFLLGLTKE